LREIKRVSLNTFEMPIIDNELVNDVPMDSFESPDGNVGEYFLERVKQNIIQLGDRTWMVSHKMI